MADVNNMVVNYQSADLLANITEQATGQAVTAPVTASEFVSVAQTALKAGYDPLMTAISQVLSRTIFSIRPYTAKFRGLMADSIRWGNHTRKLNVVDKPMQDADRYALTDGAHDPDMFDVNKPQIVQTNFYGQIAFDKCITIYRDQLDVAFSGQEEFDRFIAMIMQNAADMIEQTREELARGTIANLIAGVASQAADTIAPERVVYLVSEYNTATGSQLTADTVLLPSNFPSFARWLFGYLKTLSDRLTNRSAVYHQNFIDDDNNTLTIMRHTPVERQKMYLFSPVLNNISANVLSTVFYDKYLRLADHEDVDYWQNFNDPMTIKYTPTYTDADGSLTAPESAVTIENVFGVIFDEEAAGYTQIGEWSAPTPFEARGGYTNIWYHYNLKYWNDFTENAIVLLLDVEPSGSGE